MGKLCPRGKAAAKRKFKVYPSAYANMYASAVCSGKVTPGGKKKKAAGGYNSNGNGVSQSRKKVSFNFHHAANHTQNKMGNEYHL